MSTENEGTAVPAVPPAPSSAPAAPPAPAAPAPSDAAPGEAERTLVHEAVPQSSAPTPQPGPDPVTAPMPATPGAPAQPAYAAHEPAPAQSGGAGWPPPPPTLPSYGGGGEGVGGEPWGAPQPPAPRKRGGGLIAAVVAAALVAGGIGGAIGYFAADRDGNGSGSTTVASSDTPKDFKRDPGTVAGVAARSLPSVVTIDAQGSDGEGGTGTGFIYDKEGHILTNNHVVASAASGGGKLTATFSNGKKYDAEVVGRAQGYDVAVVKLKNAPGDLKPLALGDSDKVAVGDSTIAIGAPFGLSNTVTTGIISAKNRPVASSDGQNSKASYMSALQTDASINPGNSGGPLINSAGAVIGINSAIQSAGTGGMGQSQAGSIGLGFAIPINQAKNVAEQLIKTGQPVYPVIGASVGIQQGSGAAPGGGTDGAQISPQGNAGQQPITPGGPADKAGLKPGDVITKFGDMPIDSGPTLISEIWTHKPGDQVPLTYQRGGKETTVTITLGERKGDSN
ncbi:S1C family serine protease [Streptomyces sp. WM6378]|uniref:S1C family serine protease n=1 Tax=Streptomyces sp. WM6378 TaxID=1415557 RepID=UPI0006B034EA|nr:trypsin-like peptidase domain-containing protein [Streptomyces sp. WM6378]